jgi:uncharacterized protein with von Willebrand factor type A (vWA) domain
LADVGLQTGCFFYCNSSGICTWSEHTFPTGVYIHECFILVLRRYLQSKTKFEEEEEEEEEGEEEEEEEEEEEDEEEEEEYFNNKGALATVTLSIFSTREF